VVHLASDGLPTCVSSCHSSSQGSIPVVTIPSLTRGRSCHRLLTLAHGDDTHNAEPGSPVSATLAAMRSGQGGRTHHPVYGLSTAEEWPYREAGNPGRCHEQGFLESEI
jgi:hypothetical protein